MTGPVWALTGQVGPVLPAAVFLLPLLCLDSDEPEPVAGVGAVSHPGVEPGSPQALLLSSNLPLCRPMLSSRSVLIYRLEYDLKHETCSDIENSVRIRPTNPSP